MRRFIGSMLLAMIPGIVIGVIVGWTQIPVEADNSVLCQLSDEHRETYTLMVARGYRADQDRDEAMRRLLPLSTVNFEACTASGTTIDNIPAWVQIVTERAITRSADLEDICTLSRLSAAFGRRIPDYGDRPGTVCDQYP